MKELICIVCPKGCHLKVYEDENYRVSGNQCAKGEAYGKKELINPTRTITSTVRIKNAAASRLPVKTNGEIPKGQIMEAMALLNSVELAAPVEMGDVVLPNILGSGIDFVASRSMPRLESRAD